MKKLSKLSLIVLIPLICGIALIVIGSYGGNEAVLRVGQAVLTFGMPITVISLVVIGLVMMITGKLSDSDDSDGVKPMSKKREQSDIQDVNTSRGYKSRRKSGEYMARHVSNNYKYSTSKEKVLGWLFFGFLITDFLLIFVFGILKSIVGVIVCFSLFVGTILLSLIIKIIVEKISMRVKGDDLDDKEVFKGTVEACLMSSTTSTGGRYTTRIEKVVYRVLVDYDGEQYTAYSENYYEEGDEVFFVVRRKNLISIVDSDKVSKSDDTTF